jgi:outer membrane immunogenic protein
MKKSLLSIAAVAALLGTPAFAADMALKAPPPPPVCIWCGFYIGGNVGVIWEHDPPTVTFLDNGSGAIAAAAAGVIPLAFSYDRAGVIGGGQIGYNWQIGTLVAGLETDFDGTSLRGGQTINTAVPGFFALTERVAESTNWLGTARARLGVPWNNVLVYGTGGVAYAGVNDSFFQSNIAGGGPLSTFASETRTLVGWTAGGGFEYKWGQWSAKAEALYYNLGSHTLAATLTTAAGARVTAPPTLFFTRFTDQGAIARVGLNYHFNWWGAPFAMQ